MHDKTFVEKEINELRVGDEIEYFSNDLVGNFEERNLPLSGTITSKYISSGFYSLILEMNKTIRIRKDTFRKVKVFIPQEKEPMVAHRGVPKKYKNISIE